MSPHQRRQRHDGVPQHLLLRFRVWRRSGRKALAQYDYILQCEIRCGERADVAIRSAIAEGDEVRLLNTGARRRRVTVHQAVDLV